MIVVPQLGQGGVELFARRLAQGLAENGHLTCILVTQEAPALGASGAFSLEGDARVVRIGRGGRLLSAAALAKELQRWRPDVIISAKETANVQVAIALAVQRSSAVWIPTRHVPLSSGAGSSDFHWYTELFYRHLYRRASAFVGVSSEIATQLTALASDGIAVCEVPNPVVSTAPLHIDVETERPFWWPAGQVMMGIGRLAEQKGFDVLLRAFSMFSEQREGWSLVILGDGPDRASLQRLSEELGVSRKVVMPGHVSGATDFLRLADLFVLSSRWEGMPTVLIEALHAGIKVVSTDCPTGPSELLGDYARLLVPVGDAEALAAGMLASLAAPAPRVDVSKYSVQSAAEAYIALTERIISGRR